MRNSLFVLLAFIAIGCQQGVDASYFEEFYGDRQAHLIGLVAHEQAPLKTDELPAVSHFEYNDLYRVKAKYVPASGAQPFDMATYSGKTKAFVKKGTLNFTIKGQKEEIHVYQNLKYATHPIYGATYFIPFKDLTSAESTYGGGRYMDIDKTLFDQKIVILDFNKAYNPWCAYSDGYNCPIPPSENELDIAIEAGEKVFQKSSH